MCEFTFLRCSTIGRTNEKKTTVSTLFEKSQAAATAFSLSKKIKEVY
jgi:hypothetical protein